jgi:hypothetical protein
MGVRISWYLKHLRFEVAKDRLQLQLLQVLPRLEEYKYFEVINGWEVFLGSMS